MLYLVHLRAIQIYKKPYFNQDVSYYVTKNNL